MPIYQAVVLGLVQGLGEFLPISSSAHLAVIPWLFGWRDPGLAFDVALHWGTLVAVLAVYWRDWIRLVLAGLASLSERRLGADPDRRLFWTLVVATVPGALVGKLFHDKLELLAEYKLLIAGALAAMGVVLWLADRFGRKARSADSITFGQAALIGVGQACALVPGVSRAGATISIGLGLGLTREEAARFSFLMSTPIIFGAGLLKAKPLLQALQGHGGEAALVTPAALLAGMAAAAISGTIVIRWMLGYLKTQGYAVFAIYRLAAAAGIVAIWLAGKR